MITKNADKRKLASVKKTMDIILYLITFLQIIQELGGKVYLNYATLTLSIIECILFFYGFMQIFFIYQAKGVIITEAYETLTNFHNDFLVSLLVPMIFVFIDIGANEKNTLIYDMLKKTSIIVIFLSLGIYRILPRLAGFLKTKTDGTKRQAFYANLMSMLLVFPAFSDSLIIICMLILYLGFVIKNPGFALVSFLASLLITLIIILKIKKNNKTLSDLVG